MRVTEAKDGDAWRPTMFTWAPPTGHLEMFNGTLQLIEIPIGGSSICRLIRFSARSRKTT